jgi:DNA repair protein RecO (recombination protein O)
MPTYNDYGIVLKSFNLGERDEILNIYTKENGLVRAIAKGVKSQISKFKGKVEELSCSHFQFAKGKNLDIISEIEQITSFPKLRSNGVRLFYGLLFLEIVNSFAEEGESGSPEIYELLYSSLSELQESSNVELSSLNFILGFLSLHGFKPQFESCVACSRSITLSKGTRFPYSSILGGLLCLECSNIDHKMIDLTVLNVLNQPLEHGNNEDIRQALKILQEHLNTRAKKEIKSFDLVFSL